MARRPAVEQPDDTAIERVNEALHILMHRLNFTRLGLWSDKLEDINFFDLHVMAYAEESPDHTLGEMREYLQVPQSTLTSIIDRLERRGLIERAINARDKRSYLIKITPAGEEVQREHHRVEHMIAKRILEALPSAKARKEFVSLLTEMTRRL
jgi:DNA-binding MarR family transcriptional regulator